MALLLADWNAGFVGLALLKIEISCIVLSGA